MQHDIPVFQVVGHQCRDARAEVDVAAICDKGGRAARDRRAREPGFAVVQACRVGRAAVGTVEIAGCHRPRAFHDACHEYAGQVNILGWQCVDDLIHLDDGDARRLGEAGVEVLAAAAKLHVAEPVGAVSSQQGEVDPDRLLEHMAQAIEFADFLVRGDIGIRAGGGVEGGNARTAGTAALDQRALRHQLHFQLAGDDLPFACSLHAGAYRERRDQFAHLHAFGQDLSLDATGTAQRVAHDAQLFRALLAQRGDQTAGEAVAQPEPGDRHRGPVGDVRHRLERRAHDLVHAALTRP